MDVHDTAKKGFQQGEFYDAYRPNYVDSAVDEVLKIIKNADISTDVSQLKYDIVELGAGTGKFTRKLSERAKSERILSTEPSEGFLKTLKQQCPGVESLLCAANEIPLPDKSVKAIICAHSFHWFANIKSLTEIDRVLAPGGLLVLVYNQKDRRVPWVLEMSLQIERNMGDNPPPQYHDMKWKDIFQQFKSIEHVQDFELEGIKFVGSADYILNYIFSMSYMSNLEEEEKKKARVELRQIIEKHFGDRTDIHVPHHTIIYLYRKLK